MSDEHRDYVYLVLEKEIPDTGLGMCKLGMTNCGKYKRPGSYKGCKVLLVEAVDRSKYTEEQLIVAFKKNFSLSKGREHFEGYISDMVKVFRDVCSECSGVVPMDIS
jgi:hypothetical protein